MLQKSLLLEMLLSSVFDALKAVLRAILQHGIEQWHRCIVCTVRGVPKSCQVCYVATIYLFDSGDAREKGSNNSFCLRTVRKTC